MTKKEVLNTVDLKALKVVFAEQWDKSPRTMVQTMKNIIAAHCDGAKITTGTANALLHEIEA